MCSILNIKTYKLRKLKNIFLTIVRCYGIIYVVYFQVFIVYVIKYNKVAIKCH